MKKRILLVSSGRLDHSGVPAVIMTLVRQLAADYTFDLLLNGENTAEGPLEAQFLQYGGRIFHCRKRRFRIRPLNRLAELFRPLSLYRYTHRLLRAETYQAIHCHNEFDMAGPLAAAAHHRVPARLGQTHRVCNQERLGPLTRIQRVLCRQVICKSATALLGCSQRANTAFYGVDAGARSVAAPYDSSRFVYDGVQPPAGQLWVAQIGYFCDNKNQLFTLEVFSRLAARLPDTRLFLAGFDQGGYQGRLQKTIHKKGLEKQVTLLPPDSDLPALLQKCNLLLLPSRAEGFGIVLIEAQAMGLSCYASDTVPPETNRGGVTYLPLSAGPDAWAEAILQDRRYERKFPFDCGAFSSTGFAEQFRSLYEAPIHS